MNISKIEAGWFLAALELKISVLNSDEWDEFFIEKDYELEAAQNIYNKFKDRYEKEI